MATIRIDAGKVNKMHGLINDVKKSAADYKSELEGVKKQVLAINRSVCDLDGVLDELRISSDLQDAKMEFCDALTNDIDGFVEEAVRIDREVAARISRRADEFYEEYPWLRPDCRKSGWERFINSFKEAEEWCLDRWKETGLAARRQMAAVLAAMNQGPGQGVTGMAVALPYLVSQFLAENTADAAAWAVKLYQEKKTVRTGVNAAGATYLAVTAPVFAGVLATAGAAALAAFALTNGKKKEEELPLYILPEPTPTPTPGKGYDPEYEARIAETIPWEHELEKNVPAQPPEVQMLEDGSVFQGWECSYDNAGKAVYTPRYMDVPAYKKGDEEAVKEYMWHYFQAQGIFSDVCIAGILGNVYAESGFEPDAGGKTDPETGKRENNYYRGLFQVGGDRRTGLENQAGEMKLNWDDVYVQCAYTMHELNNGGMLTKTLDDGSYPGGLLANKKTFLAATDAATAAVIWCTSFERAYTGKKDGDNKVFTGLQDKDKRISHAEEIYEFAMDESNGWVVKGE